MAEIFGIQLGDIGGSAFSGLGSTITIIAIIVVVLLFLSIILFFFLQARVYNRKILVFENIAGRGYQLVYRDKARIIKVGDGGEEVLFLQKKKVYRTAYGSKMGKNEYWFAIGQDGYWYNFVLGDLDAKMGTLDIEPIDRDMRYMHVAIRKNITERYNKTSWIQKHGAMVMNMLLIIIVMVGIWFLLDKIGDISGSISNAVETAGQLMETSNKLLEANANIAQGGSGIRPA